MVQGHRINSRSCDFLRVKCFEAFKIILNESTFYLGDYDLGIIKVLFHKHNYRSPSQKTFLITLSIFYGYS